MSVSYNNINDIFIFIGHINDSYHLSINNQWMILKSLFGIAATDEHCTWNFSSSSTKVCLNNRNTNEMSVLSVKTKIRFSIWKQAAILEITKICYKNFIVIGIVIFLGMLTAQY